MLLSEHFFNRFSIFYSLLNSICIKTPKPQNPKTPIQQFKSRWATKTKVSWTLNFLDFVKPNKPKSGWGMKDNNIGGAQMIKKTNIWEDKTQELNIPELENEQEE